QERNQRQNANPEQPGARWHFDLVALFLVLAVVVFVVSHYSKCSAQANTACPYPQHGIPAQPLPFQSAAGLFVELETLSNPQTFHPKQVSRRRGGHNQLMSYGPGNFLVREKVLQFHLRAQANRLKPIARPPTPHQNPEAD